MGAPPFVQKTEKTTDEKILKEKQHNTEYKEVTSAYKTFVTENFVYKLEEAEINNKEEALEYATSLAKEIFGSDINNDIVNKMVDDLVDKNTKDGETDWGAIAGMIKRGYTA